MRFKNLLNPNGDDYALVRSVFVRLLGVVYLVAFVSFGVQMAGLVGSEGILPAATFLDSVREIFGFDGYRLVPTVFWVSSSDAALTAGVLVGVALSLALIVGFLQRLALVFLYVLYLSVVSVGQVFMSYQWDTLLLEVGFLSIFLTFPGPVVVCLFRALVFRFWFLSGALKMLSDDPTWSSFTALTYHYETQPLPVWTAWYAHQLPEWAHRISVGGVFFVELIAPFMVFGPRHLRYFAAFCFTGLNVLIMLTGNYTFFNILSIFLCVFLLNDEILRRLANRVVQVVSIIPSPSRARTRASPEPIEGVRVTPPPPLFSSLRGRTLTPTTAVLATFVLITGILQVWGTFAGKYPSPTVTAMRWIAPFHVVNSYGLFAVMTISRPEIIVQGSNDGVEWLDYEFKYKPGDLTSRPNFVAPHQPRLDWQMWFAALGTVQQNQWFTAFTTRLLEGSSSVNGLVAENPFPKEPPRFLRAEFYDYTFTDSETRLHTGQWWGRVYIGPYLDPVTLKQE